MRWCAALAQLPDHDGSAHVRCWGQQASSLVAAAALFLVSLWVQDTKGMGSVVGQVRGKVNSVGAIYN